MKKKWIGACALGMGLLSTAAVSYAGSPTLDLSLSDTDSYQWQKQPLYLVANDTERNKNTALSFDKSNDNFTEPLFSDSKVHQYLGLGTLALVALSAVLPKEEDGPHEYAATLAAAGAAATVTSGLITHWDDFDFSKGITEPDNMHMLLGSLGAAAMLLAVAAAPDGGHATTGIIGGLAMGVAVKITW